MSNDLEISPDYADELRDAIALGRAAIDGDHGSLYVVAEAIGISVGSRDLLHALAFIAGWLALDLAGEFPSRYPTSDDVWRDLLERIHHLEKGTQP